MLQKRQIWQYLALFVAQFTVGINIVGSKYLITQFAELQLLFLRFAIAALLLLLLYPFRPPQLRKNKFRLRDLNKRDWGFMVGQALCAGLFFNLLMLAGLHYTSASVAGIITSALPAIIVLMSIIFLRERLTIFTGLCVGLSIAGLLIINLHNLASADFSVIRGDLLILLSLIPEGAYYLLVKMHTTRLPIMFSAAIMNLINLPFILLMLLCLHQIGPLHWSVMNILVLIAVGASAALFFVFWSLGSQGVSGAMSGLFTATMPLSTLLIAWIFLGEIIGWLKAIGMLVVILAIVANALQLAWKEKRRRLKPSG